MRIAELMFVASVVALAYPLAIYPMIVWLVGTFRPLPVLKAVITPRVTVLIPAYNESRSIARTIENKLDQDYPRHLFEIIVVSDASDDGTDEIVAGYADRGVRLLRQPQRQGKAAGLNAAVRIATGEILVFSDANSLFARDAISRFVENFADSSVGYVTGCLTMKSDEPNVAGHGNSAYLKFENWLRYVETRAGSVVGVNGGVDAIRRDLYDDVPSDQITDFVLPLRVMAARKRTVFDERVKSSEDANVKLGSEFRMRVRVALRAARGLSYMRNVLNPLRYPFTAFCIWSHKVLRYVAFVFMATALVSNVMLARHSRLFAALLIVQLALYALALLGLLRNLPSPVRKLTALPTYFLASNVAFAIAAARFFRGESMATWAPRAG